jgi:hypothetical protein
MHHGTHPQALVPVVLAYLIDTFRNLELESHGGVGRGRGQSPYPSKGIAMLPPRHASASISAGIRGRGADEVEGRRIGDRLPRPIDARANQHTE